jgi:hypothetical protein
MIAILFTIPKTLPSECTGSYKCDMGQHYRDIGTSPYDIAGLGGSILTQVDDSTITASISGMDCTLSWTYAPETQQGQTSGVASKMGGLFVVGLVIILICDNLMLFK